MQLSQKSKQNMAGIDPRLIAVAEMAISITRVDFGIPSGGGLRTVAEQAALFKAGKSKCDGIKNKSEHQIGKALDFYAFVDGKASWEKEHLAMVACAFLQAGTILGVKLNWGGLWSGFVDMPHIQLMD